MILEPLRETIRTPDRYYYHNLLHVKFGRDEYLSIHFDDKAQEIIFILSKGNTVTEKVVSNEQFLAEMEKLIVH